MGESHDAFVSIIQLWIAIALSFIGWKIMSILKLLQQIVW